MANGDQLRRSLELEILKRIRDELVSGKMERTHAQRIARYILDALREEMSEQEILDLLPEMERKFSELAEAVASTLRKYVERQEKNIAEKLADLIKKGELSEARSLLKQKP